MKLTVVHTEGVVEVEDFGADGVMDLLEAATQPNSWVQLALDGDKTLVYIFTNHIIRIDVDH